MDVKKINRRAREGATGNVVSCVKCEKILKSFFRIEKNRIMFIFLFF
jgi:hypothetical protein